MTVLQFNELADIATYSKLIHDKGYRINIEKLTFHCILNPADITLAQKEYEARVIKTVSKSHISTNV